MEKQIQYLEQFGLTPEEYIIRKFKSYDVVLLGEEHRIRHNLLLTQRIIPLLYQAGVYQLGMEFGAFEDQQELDQLVMGDVYDENQARRLMFHYNVGWAFVEYMDIYRKAWEFNRTLPDGARKFRILNLSYCYNWSGYSGIRTPQNYSQVFYRGGTEKFRADLVMREIFAKKEKILILTGTVHAFTRYALPVMDYNSDGFYRLDDRFFGNLLYQKYPEQVFFILLHQPFSSLTGDWEELISPAGGMIEHLMTEMGCRPLGFDLRGTPMGELRDSSFYSTGYPDFCLQDLADGYIFEKPFAQYEGCTVDELFLTDDNWSEAQTQFPDPDMHARPASRAEYLARIRTYADVQAAYAALSI